jgi:hypothetical protein
MPFTALKLQLAKRQITWDWNFFLWLLLLLYELSWLLLWFMNKKLQTGKLQLVSQDVSYDPKPIFLNNKNYFFTEFEFAFAWSWSTLSFWNPSEVEIYTSILHDESYKIDIIPEPAKYIYIWFCTTYHTAPNIISKSSNTEVDIYIWFCTTYHTAPNIISSLVATFASRHNEQQNKWVFCKRLLLN